MKSICGANCKECTFKDSCKGCMETCGSPFGGKCVLCKYLKDGNKEKFNKLKKKLINEVNELSIKDLKIDELYPLCGFYVNLAYKLPSKEKVKFLDDKDIYLGNQVEIKNSQKCYGIVCDDKFILIVKYGPSGKSPELIRYIKR